MNFLKNKNILLIIGGGIAACKVPDLIRRFRDSGALRVSCVMTEASQKFITPLTVKVLSRGPVFTDLFDSETAHDVNHIQLSREADVVVVAPATANLMAKLANGLADDLASAILLASDKAVLMAPAMNPKMWSHAATRRNKKTLENDGIIFIGPEIGEMAERDEAGEGRMSEPREIIAAVQAFFKKRMECLKERRLL